jgi:predicted  nucleic acid-binding Zn-ribbon protein
VYDTEGLLKELNSKMEVEALVLSRIQKDMSNAEEEQAAAGNKEEIKNKIEAMHVDLEDVMTDLEAKNGTAKRTSLQASAINRDLRSITAMRADHNYRLNNIKTEMSNLYTRQLQNVADSDRLLLEGIIEADVSIGSMK